MLRVAFDEQIFAIQAYGGISRMFSELARQYVQDPSLGVELEPLPAEEDTVPRYISGVLARLQEVWVGHQVAELKSKLQRTNPVTDEPAYNQMFSTMIALEAQRKELLLQSTGEGAGL